MANVFGTNGDDFGVFALLGTEESDTMRGLAGNDALFGKGGADIMNGNEGNDELLGDLGGDLMFGDAGNDELLGGEGNDSLDGGLDVGTDSDTLNGGFGIDTATYAQVQHGMFINLFQGLAFGQGNVDTLVSIENLTGTNFDDSIVGDNNANGVQGGWRQ